MKYYMKQKVFSLKDRFTIMNESGEVIFTVEEESVFRLARKLHMYDHEGNEVAFIRQLLRLWRPCFEVYTNGNLFCRLRRKWTLLTPAYEFEGLDWSVEGRWHDHEYEVISQNRVIVSIYKVWMSWGDSYEIDVKDPVDEIPALAVVLAIDAVQADQAAAAAA